MHAEITSHSVADPRLLNENKLRTARHMDQAVVVMSQLEQMHMRVAGLENSLFIEESDPMPMESLMSQLDSMHTKISRLEVGLFGSGGENLKEIEKSIDKNKWENVRVDRSSDGNTLRVKFPNHALYKISKTSDHRFTYVSSYLLRSEYKIDSANVIGEFAKVLKSQAQKILFDNDDEKMDLTHMSSLMQNMAMVIPIMPGMSKDDLVVQLYGGSSFEVHKSVKQQRDACDVINTHWAFGNSRDSMDFQSLMDLLSKTNEIARNDTKRISISRDDYY